jgi:hypothetical protein
MDDVNDWADAYMIAPPDHDPAAVAAPLLRLPEHVHLLDGEATIDWLLKRDEKVKGERMIIGTAHMPRVSGELSECFSWMLGRLFGRIPDFLIVLDREYWFKASALEREILAYHELMHCVHKRDRSGELLYTDDDRPRWGLKGHDVEEFSAVVRRYGAWKHDIREFIAAAQAHAVQERAAPGAPEVTR